MILIDTDILIDVARGNVTAIGMLERLEPIMSCAISIITHMELVAGCRNKGELAALDNFLLRFQILPLTPDVGAGAVALMRKYRLSHGLMIPDALIAATSLVAECQFVTKNHRHYRFIPELRLIPYAGQNSEE